MHESPHALLAALTIRRRQSSPLQAIYVAGRRGTREGRKLDVEHSDQLVKGIAEKEKCGLRGQGGIHRPNTKPNSGPRAVCQHR